ncbi:MAG: chorismate mutase [Chloroflexota bacterium]|nr:chorismate mutase [Chloroflexota bacterium]
MCDWRCRGIRGATTVETNEREAILAATRELLTRMIEANEIDVEDVASVVFSTTPDLNAEFPALAARQLGWYDSALLCTHEMDVPGALDMCIRILIHWNTPKPLAEIQHIYIQGARNLRPDRQAVELHSELSYRANGGENHNLEGGRS